MDNLRALVDELVLTIPSIEGAKEVVANTITDMIERELVGLKKRRLMFKNYGSEFDKRQFLMYDAMIKNYEEAVFYLTRKSYDDDFKYSEV